MNGTVPTLSFMHSYLHITKRIRARDLEAEP